MFCEKEIHTTLPCYRAFAIQVFIWLRVSKTCRSFKQPIQINRKTKGALFWTSELVFHCNTVKLVVPCKFANVGRLRILQSGRTLLDTGCFDQVILLPIYVADILLMPNLGGTVQAYLKLNNWSKQLISGPYGCVWWSTSKDLVPFICLNWLWFGRIYWFKLFNVI